MADLKDVIDRLFRGGARVAKKQSTPAREKVESRSQPASTLNRAQASASNTAPASGERSRVLNAPSTVRTAKPQRSYARRPDAWVKQGLALQPAQCDGPILRVQIGLDFGTSYTKVALRFKDRVLVIDWSGILASGDFRYLPGELSLVGDDEVFLGKVPGRQGVFRNLKLAFLQEGQERARTLLAVAFLSRVFIYVRAWLWRHHEAELSGRRVAWLVNVGCPTNHWGKSTLQAEYRDAVLRAWAVSQESENITLARVARAVLDPAPTEGDVGLDAVSVVPEFVAEIAEYVFSPQRRDGLHLLVDVGAGTVDIACFNVHDEAGENVFPIFSSAVKLLGTHYLMRQRLQEVGCSDIVWSDRHPVPDVSMLADKLSVGGEKLQTADAAFMRSIATEVAEVLDDVKLNYYSRPFVTGSGIPLFLMGGGAMCGVYQDAMTQAYQWMRVPLIEMQPAALSNTKDREDHDIASRLRLSVAYGLTFDGDSLGTIKTSDQIEKLRITRDPIVRPGRDDLYPE